MKTPTVVLVHGAFADRSVWAGVSPALARQRYPARVPPVSNRSLSADAADIKSFVEQIDGPVVLAGHSYGGAVITVAGDADNVVGLVYVAGHALVEGESIRDLHGEFPDSYQSGNVVRSLDPNNGSTGDEFSVGVDAFPELFAPGIRRGVMDPLAAAQRPLSATAVNEPAATAAWRSKPGWGIVAAADRVINPDIERFGYERAGLRKIIEIDAPHLVMLTHPEEVVRVIVEALREIELHDDVESGTNASRHVGVTP